MMKIAQIACAIGAAACAAVLMIAGQWHAAAPIALMAAGNASMLMMGGCDA